MSDSNSSDSEDEAITHTEPTDDAFNIQVLVAAAADAENAENASHKKKRKHTSSSEREDEQEKKPEEAPQSISKIVATHYNQLEEKGLAARKESRIFFMRKFHNWIKSTLIDKYMTKIKDAKKDKPITVLDMCCGKGGDLFKWQSARISHLVCTDIAEVSLDQCETRFEQMQQRVRHRDNDLFSIEYIHADCSRIRLKEKYKDPNLKFDMVSCQFSFHYSFESLPQAECMMRNAAECLAPGGYFLLTIPNANELVARMRKSGAESFGNDVYKVTFDCDVNDPPLFGGMYHFHLDGAVDCPEFLVHVPTLQKLADRYNLILILKQGFPKFYKDMVKVDTHLLHNMRTLELYPPHEGTQLAGTAPDDYAHAERYLDMLPNRDPNKRLGTLSKSEWEASSLYLVLAFLKARD